ncbi:alpha/beta hydrolase [Nocardia sp. NBC_01503]|uniref:poly(ethylene terephthalate) hydrolase family protein n=1 Tax=Nocardia sp. NBC_01503 TaxID=2975997 RepID=UPI002E7B4413|nr:alpha/beta hydrolase [Nocardia sp. NBC_01503]WTL33512.1 alpha/beta hydrolase [Nocardia sp. NBC_01503]
MRVMAPRRAVAAALAAATMLAGSWTAVAAADEPAPAATAQTVFGGDGPHPVSTSVRTNPCQDSVYGMIQHIAVHLLGNRDDLTCTQAFPNGLESPAGVNTYYPADIADLGSAPLIVLTGGFDSNPGQYDRLARQWVSNGFVVVIAYEWFNSLAYVPAAALAVAMTTDRDPASPLYRRIDLSHTVFAGHSGGGQASLQIATLLPPVEKSVDPELHVTGVLAIQPGPLAVGALINVPTLFLTGYNDFVVPDFAWVRWWQYNLTFNAPAWIANARGVSHFSVVDGIDNYLSAGTAVAWLRYLGFGDETAKSYFVGPDWQLPADQTYFSVERNALANEVR